MEQIWLPITEDVSIGVDIDKAYTMSEKEFYKLHRKSLLAPGRKGRKVAKAWAKQQVEERNEALFLDWYLGEQKLKLFYPPGMTEGQTADG